jgi:ATP-dependent DNA helicase RecQ
VHNDLITGKTKMLYVAPETLTKAENLEIFSDLKISFFAVDEAHCISEWGHDFRPEYRRLRDMMEEIAPGAPMIALSRNRLNRKGRTASGPSGPPRLKRTTARRLISR